MDFNNRAGNSGNHSPDDYNSGSASPVGNTPQHFLQARAIPSVAPPVPAYDPAILAQANSQLAVGYPFPFPVMDPFMMQAVSMFGTPRFPAPPAAFYGFNQHHQPLAPPSGNPAHLDGFGYVATGSGYGGPQPHAGGANAGPAYGGQGHQHHGGHSQGGSGGTAAMVTHAAGYQPNNLPLNHGHAQAENSSSITGERRSRSRNRHGHSRSPNRHRRDETRSLPRTGRPNQVSSRGGVRGAHARGGMKAGVDPVGSSAGLPKTAKEVPEQRDAKDGLKPMTSSKAVQQNKTRKINTSNKTGTVLTNLKGTRKRRRSSTSSTSSSSSSSGSSGSSSSSCSGSSSTWTSSSSSSDDSSDEDKPVSKTTRPLLAKHRKLRGNAAKYNSADGEDDSKERRFVSTTEVAQERGKAKDPGLKDRKTPSRELLVELFGENHDDPLPDGGVQEIIECDADITDVANGMGSKVDGFDELTDGISLEIFLNEDTDGTETADDDEGKVVDEEDGGTEDEKEDLGQEESEDQGEGEAHADQEEGEEDDQVEGEDIDQEEANSDEEDQMQDEMGEEEEQQEVAQEEEVNEEGEEDDDGGGNFEDEEMQEEPDEEERKDQAKNDEEDDANEDEEELDEDCQDLQ